MESKVLVIGAPGNVGSEVVKGLSGITEFRIGAHQVERARQALGADHEYVRFDFLNPSTYAATFAGIEKMFMIRPPALANVKRDIAPALYAARQAGVKHIVFLSLQGVEKNRIVPHHKIEQLIRELGFSYTFLRAGFFMQNLSTTHRAEIRDRSQVSVPVGRARTSFVDVRDIAAVVVQVLTEGEDENRMYTLTGSEALTYYQVSEILSTVLARPIRYTNPSLPGFVRQQLSEGRKFSFALIMAGLYTITRFGNASGVSSDIQEILARPAITFRQFALDNRACWLVPA